MCLWALLLPFLSPSFAQPPNPSQIPEPQIVHALHAVWVPDTTVTPAMPECVASGTVAAPRFHFYAGWKDGAPAFFSIDWILIEELTSTHEPQVYYLGNPQPESGLPSDCTKVPVSDPEKWNWTSWEFWWSRGFEMHDAAYRVTVQWRYSVYMKGPRGPFQTSITINVQNLVVTSGDVGKILKWDPDRPEICDTSFGYDIECAQKKQVQVRISIYSMDGQKVYEVTEQKMCPGSYGFVWDGSVNTGYGGGYEGEPSNIAPAGLYTFDVEVMGPAYYDADGLRSKALTVVPGPVEYFGYDDGGTPDDESDDNYLYYLRWYALYSGRDASWGEIWLYDPDFERVGSWAVVMLECVVHGWSDGLVASPEGEVHGVIIPVPVSVMEKEGTYRFVLHFYDDYGDSYRNHQVKAALEVNMKESLKVFHIEDDWMVTPKGKELKPFARSAEVKSAFRRAGWIVHTAGSKCRGQICVIPLVCMSIPYRPTLPDKTDRREYSREYFFYYDKRNINRYVHVIGAAYMTGPNDGYYGMSEEEERYVYVFVKLHLDIGGATESDTVRYIKSTVIHELGHQFGLDDHPADKTPPKTRNGKFCVMWASAPSALIDLEFCNECLRRIRNYGW